MTFNAIVAVLDLAVLVAVAAQTLIGWHMEDRARANRAAFIATLRAEAARMERQRFGTPPKPSKEWRQ